VKKIIATAIIIIASIITMTFLILMNDIMISIRLNELKSNLQDIDRREGSIDNVGLVATYEIHKKLFEDRISQEEADAIEQRINSLVILEKEKNLRSDVMFTVLSFPALTVINFNRRVLGKTPLAYFPGDDSDHIHIDLAYYYERNFRFNRAIELYNKSLINDNLTSSLRAGALLHQGYCYALSGFNDKARRNYLTVIENYSQESSAITATILLKYLEGFRLARERVLNTKGDPLATSQHLVNLLAFKQALSILTTAESNARPGDLPRIKYFMGRCFTGMGETNKAVENYLQVITSSPSSPYAIYANRKLFIAGSSGGSEKIQKLSIELNKAFSDPVLTRMIEDRGRITTNKNIDKNAIKIDIPPNLKATVDTLIANKNETGLKKGHYYIIFTSDGNIFRGTLIGQTTGHIAIMTSIGRIDVKQSRVVRVTEK
jgi:tetratricopeptide (TPR) repeat protein